jgi:hypothetical protein
MQSIAYCNDWWCSLRPAETLPTPVAICCHLAAIPLPFVTSHAATSGPLDANERPGSCQEVARKLPFVAIASDATRLNNLNNLGPAPKRMFSQGQKDTDAAHD